MGCSRGLRVTFERLRRRSDTLTGKAFCFYAEENQNEEDYKLINDLPKILSKPFTKPHIANLAVRPSVSFGVSPRVSTRDAGRDPCWPGPRHGQKGGRQACLYPHGPRGHADAVQQCVRLRPVLLSSKRMLSIVQLSSTIRTRSRSARTKVTRAKRSRCSVKQCAFRSAIAYVAERPAQPLRRSSQRRTRPSQDRDHLLRRRGVGGAFPA